MNASSTSPFPPCRPGTDPVFGQLGGGLIRTSLRSLRLQWILYRAARRKTRTIEPGDNMNVHMLRDIGVTQETLSRGATPRPACERHGLPFGLWVLLVALALTGSAAPTSSEAARPAKPQASGVPLPAVFAGEYVNGAPVYRFPAVVVMGSRTRGSGGKAAAVPGCVQVTAGRNNAHMRGSPRALTFMVAPGATASWARWVTPRNT